MKKRNAAAISRACADDIGQALRALAHLKISFPIFQMAKRFAGLTLKPSKCKLIPLVENYETVKPLIISWLSANVPDWVNFDIVPCAIYLGFYLGPGASGKQWEAPLKNTSIGSKLLPTLAPPPLFPPILIIVKLCLC